MFTKQEIEVTKQIPAALKKLSGGKWEWEPEIGELCSVVNNIAYPIIAVHGNYIDFWDRDKQRRVSYDKSAFYPLLYWEKLEETLEKMGYLLWVIKYHGENPWCECKIGLSNHPIIDMEGKTRQEAVCRAILELVKEKKGK